MSKKIRAGLFAAMVLLVWGIVRAAVSRYAEQHQAILAGCEAERKRLRLTEDALGNRYSEVLYSKYSTPEITLCPLTRLLPGGSGEIVVSGKFVPGTKVFFDNDNIEVAKETATPSQYRLSVKVAQEAGPGVANLRALTPVSCASLTCPAVFYIGGKYEWNFTAANGWRIKLKILDEDFTGKQGSHRAGEWPRIPSPIVCAEYYRGTETNPFAVRRARLSLANPSSYEAEVSVDSCDTKGEEKPSTSGAQAEMAKLNEKLTKDYANLSPSEQQQVMKRMQELTAKMMQEQEAQLAKMRDPKELQKMEAEKKRKDEEREKKWKEICRILSWRPAAGGRVEGVASCDDWNLAKPGRWGKLPLTGSMKYLGQ